MYDIVFYLSDEAVAAGAKIKLINGQYVVTKAPQTTIQAVNGGVPPTDQTAEVAALKARIANALAAVA